MIKRSLLILSFCIVTALPSFSQAQSLAAQQSADTAGAFAKIKSAVRFERLSNGLRVIFLKRGQAPVFAGAVVVRVGSTDEPAGETGIAHMFEHMAFKGTPEIGTSDYEKEKTLLAKLEVLASAKREQGQFNPGQSKEWQETNAELAKLWVNDQFSREYEKRGATGLNATTDTELTRYFVNLPRSAFEFWCYMESERLLRPVLRQFYQERDVVLEERRMRVEDDPDGKMYELLLQTAFNEHPYHNPVIGYTFDIQRLTASDLDHFRKRFYVPSNIVIAVVGDVDPQKDLPLLERYFGRLPVGPAPTRPWAVEPKQQGERSAVLEARYKPELSVAYRKPQFPDPDDAPISIMHEILAGGRVAPIYVDLVRDSRLATQVSCNEAPGAAYPNLMVFDITPRAPHASAELLRAFDREIEIFKKKGATRAQLERAKRSFAMGYLAEFKSNMSMALSLAGAEALYGRWQSNFDWYDQALAVTVDDVNRVARKYLVPEGRSVIQLIHKQELKSGAGK